jgi:hypothetical protein
MEFRVPRGIYGRRLFWGFVVGGALVLFCVRYLALPLVRNEDVFTAGRLLEQVLDDMLAAVLVAGLLTALLSYFAPEADVDSAVEIVPAKDRGPRLVRYQADTRQWWFSGSMGRYTRAKTLPALAAACREDGRGRTIVLQLIDPRDRHLCQRYANLRRSLREGERVPWSVEHVQREVLSTIAAAYTTAAQQSLLDVRVALRPTLNQQRYDLSDSGVIITTEDERRDAICYPSCSPFYDTTRDELRLSLTQSHALPGTPWVIKDQMGIKDLQALLETVGLGDIFYAETDLKAILDSIKDPKNPYG